MCAKPSPDDLLTVAQVAALKGCSERTIRSAAEQGKLAGQRIGWAWLFRRGDIEDWTARPVGRPKLYREKSG